MVEATIGSLLLLFVCLAAIQLVLVFHGNLAAHGAVTRAARTYALTRDDQMAGDTFAVQMSTALGALRWNSPRCYLEANYRGTGVQAAQCQVSVYVPFVLPVGGLFGNSQFAGTIRVDRTGVYPYGEKSGV